LPCKITLKKAISYFKKSTQYRVYQDAEPHHLGAALAPAVTLLQSNNQITPNNAK
jgi:hypothetical protein